MSCQVLHRAAVPNDADGPEIHLLLVLAEQYPEGFAVARRESF